MKKAFLLFSLILCSLIAFAQNANTFKYQGVARDANQQPFANTAIGLQLSVVLDNGSGTGAGVVQYVERHLTFTSPVGVFSLQAGAGETTFGDWSELDWGNGNYWLKVEMDVEGGDNYVYMGNSPILSVPLAMHAQTVTDKDDADADPANELQTISFDPTTNELTISAGNTINIPAGNADADADPANEIQTLGFDPETGMLSLTDGGTVDLSTLEAEGSDDQQLALNGNVLTIENGNAVDLSALQDGITDADADPNNELQTISFDPDNNELTISSGNTITIPAGNADADADPSNELQDLALNGLTLSIEGGNEVNLAAVQDGTEDADADPSNELQTLGFDPETSTLSLSDGGTVDLSTLEAEGSDDQELALNGNVLTIENGNAVDLSALQDGTTDADADPNNELQTISFDPDNNELTISSGNTITIPAGNADADADPSNELQDLALNGLILSIEGGNEVDLAAVQDGTEDADADPSNELQDLALNGLTLSIEGGNEVNLAAVQDGTEDADADPGNELQNLTLDGLMLSIDNGNSINLAAVQDGTADADADPANEIQVLDFDPLSSTLSLTDGGSVDLSSLDGGGSDDQLIQLNGNILTIENGNAVDLGVLQDGTEDDDADPNNELQNLQLNGLNLSISNGNQVNLALVQDGNEDADADPFNELQNLVFNEVTNELSILSGNTVSLPYNPDDNDADPFNELQTLNLNGNLLSLSGGNQVDLSSLGGSSLWTQTPGHLKTLDNVIIGLDQNSNILSTLEVKDDITIRRSTGAAYVDMFGASNGGNIIIYRGNGTGGNNDISLNLSSTPRGGYLDLRDSDGGIRSNWEVNNSGGADFSLSYPDGEEAVSMSTFNASSGLTLYQPDGDDCIRLGSSSFGGFMATYGSGGNIATDIGRNPAATNSGLMRIYNAAGDVGVEASADDNAGELRLYNNNSENVYLGRSGSALAGKVSISDAGETEKAGMFIGIGNVGTLFADVKNFRMEHPQEADKEIWYACVEGPEAAAYERGTAQLVDGEATIEFAEHFELVANHETMTVMLTPLSADCKGLAVVEKTANGFKVKELFQGTGTYAFDWEVKTVRRGYENYEVIRDKKDRL